MRAPRPSIGRLVRHSFVLGLVLAATLGASASALAQAPPTSDQGPRFGQWGPGQAPPEPEGPAGPESAAPQPRFPGGGPDVGPGSRGARPETLPAPAPGPYAAPPPGPEYAPPPAPDRWGGCDYDLRGTWQITGRQTSPYSYSYSARIHVRQYRGWLQIDQPEDGLSYYGVCRGNSIQLDVYSGSQFIGYEDGTISYRYEGRPRALACPAPWCDWGWGRGARVTADWVSFVPGFASGHETWHRW